MFDIFKQLKNLAEKENGYFIKALRTNHGGKFTSVIFNKFYEDHGIRHFLTAPYSPQQNGVAERKIEPFLTWFEAC